MSVPVLKGASLHGHSTAVRALRQMLVSYQEQQYVEWPSTDAAPHSYVNLQPCRYVVEPIFTMHFAGILILRVISRHKKACVYSKSQQLQRSR